MPRDKRLPRGPVAATSYDAAASAHGLDCPVVGKSPAQRKGALDEPYIRMDGRRDGDLYGDRRAAGGPAGRRDYQNVQ